MGADARDEVRPRERTCLGPLAVAAGQCSRAHVVFTLCVPESKHQSQGAGAHTDPWISPQSPLLRPCLRAHPCSGGLVAGAPARRPGGDTVSPCEQKQLHCRGCRVSSPAGARAAGGLVPWGQSGTGKPPCTQQGVLPFLMAGRVGVGGGPREPRSAGLPKPSPLLGSAACAGGEGTGLAGASAQSRSVCLPSDSSVFLHTWFAATL